MSLQEKDVPAWYGLTVRNQSLAFMIRPDVWMSLKREMNSAKSMQDAETFGAQFGEHQIYSFTPPFSHVPSSRRGLGWGFGNFFSTRTEDTDWIYIHCRLPKAYDRPAPAHILYSITCSIQFLLETLNHKRSSLVTDRNQHAVVRLMTKKSTVQGSELHVDLFPSFVMWLNGIRPTVLQKVSLKMFKIYKYMTGIKLPSIQKDFSVTIHEGRLSLRVLGKSCSLRTPDAKTEGGPTKNTLFPYNIDDPFQQLTLLFGLTILSTEARKAGI